MEMEPREKAILVLAVGLMAAALLGIVVLGSAGTAYYLWAELEPPPPPSVPALPSVPPGQPVAEAQMSMVGVWMRTDDNSNSLALFSPIRSEGYGYFHSSIVGEGAWFAGENGSVYLIDGEGITQVAVSFPTPTTMVIQGPGGTQTWRKLAGAT
jgi:hypothetical protein